MDVSILIISFNTRKLTLACLRSVFAETRGVEFEVIVVDNASHDGSADAVGEQFPQVTLLRPGRNLGFAAGNNLAARQARGEYVLLLNPDTEILAGAVQRIVGFAREHAEAGVVGGRTLKADGSLDYRSCHARPTPWSAFCMATGIASLLPRSRVFNPESLGAWRRDSVRTVDAITGCFLLAPRALWGQLGGFDESFFIYAEDTDLCLRAAALGYQSLICPDATIIHHGAQSDHVRPDKVVRLFRAKAQLFRKHWRPGLAPLGLGLLDLHALSRVIALGMLRHVRRGGRADGSYDVWREVWRRRREFRPPPMAPPAADDSAGECAAVTWSASPSR